MRQNRTRKSPPPQRNAKLQETIRELAVKAEQARIAAEARNSKGVPSDVIDITVEPDDAQPKS